MKHFCMNVTVLQEEMTHYILLYFEAWTIFIIYTSISATTALRLFAIRDHVKRIINSKLRFASPTAVSDHEHLLLLFAVLSVYYGAQVALKANTPSM